MKLWSDEFISEITFFKDCSFYSRDDVINPKLGQKGPKLGIHVSMVMERWKSIVKGNLRWSIRSILKPLSQNFEILTPRGDVINSKRVKKIQIGIWCTNVDRKLKIKSKRYFEVFICKPIFSRSWNSSRMLWFVCDVQIRSFLD